VLCKWAQHWHVLYVTVETDVDRIRIANFRVADQVPVRELIIAGLAEHWGTADPSLNPDLDDIAATYAGATVLVAWLDERTVGMGTLVSRSEGVGEIVRMSVAADLRNRGIGKLLLTALCDRASTLGRIARINGVIDITGTYQTLPAAADLT